MMVVSTLAVVTFSDVLGMRDVLQIRVMIVVLCSIDMIDNKP